MYSFCACVINQIKSKLFIQPNRIEIDHNASQRIKIVLIETVLFVSCLCLFLSFFFSFFFLLLHLHRLLRTHMVYMLNPLVPHEYKQTHAHAQISPNRYTLRRIKPEPPSKRIVFDKKLRSSFLRRLFIIDIALASVWLSIGPTKWSGRVEWKSKCISHRWRLLLYFNNLNRSTTKHCEL